jgi:3-hydroxyacyl-CoA dehydrogenase
MSTFGVVGAGVIGASWTALFLAQGHDVVATDPAPDAEAGLRAQVAAHWPALRQRGLAAGASPERLAFTLEPGEVAERADFVQESGPEREELKPAVFAQLDEAAAAGVVLASSSSGLMPSAIQARCTRHPERVLVGHPFNPAHLIPLVEVVGGAATSEAAIERAMTVYRGLGKRPIRIRQEINGHVANRLQAALWREAYSLVERGVASVADIDTAISYGPGLRWALIGPLVNQHLSGGDAGLSHVLAHLGPPMLAWWADLGEPTLSPELVATLIAGVDAELAGIDQSELVSQRDELLDLLLAAKAARPAIP